MKSEIRNGTFTEITKAEIKNGTFTEIVICRVFLGDRTPALGFATKNPITFFIEIWSPQGPFASVPYTRSGGRYRPSLIANRNPDPTRTSFALRQVWSLDYSRARNGAAHSNGAPSSKRKPRLPLTRSQSKRAYSPRYSAALRSRLQPPLLAGTGQRHGSCTWLRPALGCWPPSRHAMSLNANRPHPSAKWQAAKCSCDKCCWWAPSQ